METINQIPLDEILLDHPFHPEFKTAFKNLNQTSNSLKFILSEDKILDLTQSPHLLIAGQTGSGKSVCINSIICSLILSKTPEELRLVLIDPKVVELSGYQDIPHLLTDVVTETEKAIEILNHLILEMESRFKLLSESKVRNIQSYNQKNPESKLPFIVVVIDEFADLMYTSKKTNLEMNIIRLAQKARAVGIHLILATQRPSVNVITGILKANIPSRIAFKVPSQIDSRTIIDGMGAESLKGKGDCLVKEGQDLNRVQACYLTDGQIEIIQNSVSCEVRDFERI